MAATSTLKKRPGGRPKKAEAERRSVQRKIRYTIAEDIHVKQQAAAAGMTEAEYVRRCCLHQPIIVRQDKTDARLVHELNRIGVNFNIYIRDILSERKDHPAEVMIELRRKLDHALDLVLDAFND